MFVNKYQINLTTLPVGTTATTINIPLNMEYQLVDQAELVDRVFVQTEVKKCINPIYDYEKVRFIPVQFSANTIPINTISYVLDMDGATNYGDIGFVDDDVKYLKESFKQTFIYLAFYDTPSRMTQKLISFVTLFTKLGGNDLNTDPNLGGLGTPKPVHDIQLNFDVANPVLFPFMESEGYHLYDFKDELAIGESKVLYMRASFKNAKDGKETNLMVTSAPQNIDVLVNELYTKFELFRTNTGFYYRIVDNWVGNDPDNTNVINNVTYGTDNITIKLYKIKAI